MDEIKILAGSERGVNGLFYSKAGNDINFPDGFGCQKANFFKELAI